MKYLQQQLLDFINKYPKQAHFVAVILAGLVGSYAESQTMRTDISLLIAQSHIPHIGTIASVIGGLIVWYTQHEK